MAVDCSAPTIDFHNSSTVPWSIREGAPQEEEGGSWEEEAEERSALRQLTASAEEEAAEDLLLEIAAQGCAAVCPVSPACERERFSS